MQPDAAPADGRTTTGPPARKPRAFDVLASLGRPKVAIMLALGFSSGLPFMLFGNTLGFWLADDHIDVAVIGFLSWAGLPYLLKFVWGAAADRLRPPVLGALGRRRSWMIVSQIAVAAGLFGMAATDPRAHLAILAGFAVLTGLGGATQDTVIDAWRIESAVDGAELGLLTAAYSLGFRVALVATESVILVIAERLSWPAAYAIFAATVAVGLVAALAAREPERADAVMEEKSAAAAVHPLRAVQDAVVGPLVVFFRTHGLALAVLMLAMISLYHLSDYMRGPMTNPYYSALSLSKTTIAGVRASIGLAGSILGIALGGIVILRLGVMRTLMIGAVVQPLAVALFALLAWRGGDFIIVAAGPLKVTGFEAIMGFDSLAMGFSGVALVSYMSTLTSLGYTATQYALLTSALAWTGKSLKGFSGLIVKALEPGRTLIEAFGIFYLFAAVLSAPAIVLCLVLAARKAAPAPAAQPLTQTT